MKKFFVILAIALLLMITGLAIFVATFDANRYKSLLISKIEGSIDRDVKIGDLSLGILHGPAIKVSGVTIKDRQKTWENYLLKASDISINLKLLPLLKKDIQIQRLSISKLEINTGAGANSPIFRCSLDLSVRILINSLSQDDMLKTLSAKGNARLTNAVLDKINVLKTVLDSLSMLPNVVQNLKDNLPENYKRLLNQDYTVFKPMKADFEIKDGRIYFDGLLVESDAFYLVNKGSVGMIDQSIGISSNLFIPKDLSGAFSNIVPAFKYLAGDNGLITMPLDIKGKIPNIAVMPDLNYVLQKLIALKGQELLKKFFER